MPPLVRVIVFVGVFAGLLGWRPAAAQTLQTVAPFALVEDYDSGAILFDKNAEELMPPASTSKLIVAEMVFRELKEGRLKLEDKVRVSEYAWRTGGAKTHGSTMFLRPKSEVRVEDLLRGMIIQSGNDAAITLAEALGGTEDNFVALMNKRAAELGMAHSHFTNAWGRSDPGERVTARDMARLAAWIIKTYPEYYHYFGEKDFTWDKIRQPNRNPLLAMDIGADGLKTGDTAESGYGLVGSAVQDGQRLIVVVNGLKTASERAEESRKMFNWAFRAFEPRVLFQAGDTVGTAEVFGGDKSEVALTCANPLKVFVLRASSDRLSAKIVYKGPLVAPVEEGLAVGALKVYRGQTLLMEAPLQTKEAAPLGTLSRRALDGAMEIAGDWIRQVFRGALMVRGRFVTLEGGEGAGKSVQTRRLAAELRALGLEVIATREPGGSPHAEALRERILRGDLAKYGPAAEALLFSAARIDHLDVTIAPALARGAWVLSDRFADSTRAYQGAAGRLEPEFIARLEQVAVGDKRPDLTLILDLPPDVGLARAATRRGIGAGADRFEREGLGFHRTLRDAFLKIARDEPARCVVIDAQADEATVAAAIMSAVRERLAPYLPGAA